MKKPVFLDTVRASRDIYVEHLTGVPQYDNRKRYGRGSVQLRNSAVTQVALSNDTLHKLRPTSRTEVTNPNVINLDNFNNPIATIMDNLNNPNVSDSEMS